jgi:hypothetical protein
MGPDKMMLDLIDMNHTDKTKISDTDDIAFAHNLSTVGDLKKKIENSSKT